MYNPRATPALLTTLVVAALTLGITSPAAAHDGLIAASPEPGSTVTTELSQVALDFSQDFLDMGGLTTAFAIQVSGPDGNFYNVGCVTVQPSRISIGTQLGESGQYTVVWQIVSSDGHPTSDTYQFSYNKPADTAAAAGSAIADTCTPAVTPTPSASSEPFASSGPTPPSPPADGDAPAAAPLPLIIGGIGAFTLAVTAVVVLVRRRRSP
ncbi:MAG TPA: copper resistance protein CopC [Rhodoglobus sp.]|nr:copper resistance protein CopC [Rhodoglobus sp.]